MGVDLLRQQSRANNVNFVQRRTSPVIATILSMLCPGLGAAYNGQLVKALVYFGIFVGLFQMALLTKGMPLFVFGFIGMWSFAALDSWRTAQMIRSGLTPDVADDILVKRFAGNPKLWGIVLGVLGLAFIFQKVLSLGFILRAILPVFLIALGIYVLRGYIFKSKAAKPGWTNSGAVTSFAISNQRPPSGNYSDVSDFTDRSRSGSWRDV